MMNRPTPRQIQNALSAIRARRSTSAGEGTPQDLGCEVYLYLGLAIDKTCPRIKWTEVASLVGVHTPDALFYGALCELARNSDWIKRDTLDAAVSALQDKPVAAPRPSNGIEGARKWA